MAEPTPEDKELYRLRTTGFWVSIAIGFVTLRLVLYLGKPWLESWRNHWDGLPLLVAFVAALIVMMIAGRVLPWYREVQRREDGRKPPVLSLMLTQGIAFGAILLLLQTVFGML
jgi:hypothetical protein